MARPKATTVQLSHTVEIPITENFILEHFTADQLLALLQRKLSGVKSSRAGDGRIKNSAVSNGRKKRGRRGRPSNAAKANNEMSQKAGAKRSKRKPMSAAAKARIAESTKKRWAAARKAGKKTL